VTLKRTFWGVALIPILYVAAAFAVDFTMFAIMGIAFPKYYAVSFLLLVAFAAVISCIPSRVAQIVVFSCCISLQCAVSIANLLAYNNLGEIFTFETLRAGREIWAGAGAAKYQGIWHFIVLCLIGVAFLSASIYFACRYRRQKSGYALRSVVGIASAVMIVMAGLFAHLAIIDNRATTSLERLLDPRFSLTNFTNRTKVLHNFGSPIYYSSNLMSIAGLKNMASSPVSADIELDWDGADYYDKYVDEEGNSLMLDADYNLIMIMMESVELDALNPVLTPNLWEIKQQSTWVDGYYSVERTCFAEFVSLTGSHAMGSEMWRDYPNVESTQSIANIFRRAYEDKGVPHQIGGFHSYDSEFYGRDKMFTPARYGFDFMRDIADPRYGGVEINRYFATNSDVTLFTEMKEDIAPSDGTSFLSFVLNISTHSPHFNPKHVNYNKHGEIESVYTESLERVMEPETYKALEEMYPKLKGSASEKLAAVAYFVGMVEYDRGMGILLEHLRGDNEHGVDLLEKTALVLYADHFNYMSYNNPANTSKGGIVSANNTESPIGEKLPFIIYNPKDRAERKITGFMSNNDIYKTICHLFNVETHGNYTLGASVLARLGEDDWHEWPALSAAIGFYTGVFFGTDLSDPDLHFSTRDFKTYQTNQINTLTLPSEETIAAYMDRLDVYASTLLKLHSYFDGDKFKSDPRTYYKMGGQ